MGAQHIRKHTLRAQQALLAGQPVPFQVAALNVNDRLVERDPECAQAPEFLRRLGGQAGEALDDGRVFPAALLRQPAGVGEMVQGHERREAVGARLRQQVAVEAPGGCVPVIGAGLDAAPFNGEAVRIVTERASERKVFSVAPAPPVAGHARGVAALDVPGCLFPVPPVVVEILALDLVRRRRAAPEETGRERHKNTISVR